MNVDVALLPGDLAVAEDDVVVVFDVLRATTSMIVALAAGSPAIHIFDTIDEALQAAGRFGGPRLLAGEVQCLPPAGFDLGNSPAGFADCSGSTIFLATTNGTRAIIAARAARTIAIGALVNARAVARHLLALGRDVKLICAGTQGQVAMEDLLGAGAVINAMMWEEDITLATDTARIALGLFRATADELEDALAHSTGGQNIIRAGLADDIAFAARLNSIPVVGLIQEDPLRVIRA
jgi:2-phosphosulfolactate phosphatase